MSNNIKIKYKILIVEIESTGHHISSYLKSITNMSKNYNNIALSFLTTESVIESIQFREISDTNIFEHIHLCDYQESKEIRNYAFGLLYTQLLKYMSVRRGYNEMLKSRMNYDMVFVINIDHFDKVITLLGSPFHKSLYSGILMNIKYHRKKLDVGPKSRSDVVYQYLFNKLLADQSLSNLFVIDELLFDNRQLFIKNKTMHDKVKMLNDVGEIGTIQSRTDARNEQLISKNAFVILVYGFISTRKGIYKLLEVLNDLPSIVTVLVVGQHEPQVYKHICDNYSNLIQENNLIIKNMYCTSQMESYYYSICDCVWLGYEGTSYGSSGVLYQSCSAGKPVFSYEDGLLGYLVKKYELGFLSGRKNEQIINTLKKIIYDRSKYTAITKNMQDIAKYHTSEYFGSTILDCLYRVLHVAMK